MHALSLLREMGLDPAADEARRAVGLVRDRVTWQGCGPPETDDHPFFAGEVEPCINAQVCAVGAYFGQDVRGIADRLLAEQLVDGGWNCEAANNSTRSSFNTTICVRCTSLCVGAFRCVLVRAAGINFQACLIDRSSISPFRINDLRPLHPDYRTRRGSRARRRGSLLNSLTSTRPELAERANCVRPLNEPRSLTRIVAAGSA